MLQGERGPRTIPPQDAGQGAERRVEEGPERRPSAVSPQPFSPPGVPPLIIPLLICRRTDYVTWNGPDPDLRRGTDRALARGPNAQLRRGASGGASGSRIARGPNPSLRKGAAVGAAKGSIYSQVQRAEEASTRGN